MSLVIRMNLNPKLFDEDVEQIWHQKTALRRVWKPSRSIILGWSDTKIIIPHLGKILNKSVDSPGVEPGRFGVSDQPSNLPSPHQRGYYQTISLEARSEHE